MCGHDNCQFFTGLDGAGVYFNKRDLANPDTKIGGSKTFESIWECPSCGAELTPPEGKTFQPRAEPK